MATKRTEKIKLPELDTLLADRLAAEREATHFELRIETSGRSGQVNTHAGINLVGPMMCTFILYQDYSEYIERTRTRATQKNIDVQHGQVMVRVDEIKAAAIAHYQAEPVD